MEGAGVRPCSCSQEWSPDGFCDFPKDMWWVVTRLSLGRLVLFEACPHCLFSAKLTPALSPPHLCLVFCAVWVACVSLCPPREVTPLLGQCRLAVTVVCTEQLKCTFPLVLFVAVLNCLLFPCVLAHYFLLIHGLCNYLGNAVELAGIWRAWLLFLGVNDFLLMQGRVGTCPLWVTSCTSRPLQGALQAGLAVWRELESPRSRERVSMWISLCTW